MAPSMSQNSIAKLLMAADETTAGAKVHMDNMADEEASPDRKIELEFEILEQTIPYSYVTECLSLLRQLELRLQSDIYRGILLEVVQRIITDVQMSLMQGETVTSSSLLLAHAHFAFLFKEFLSGDSVLASPLSLRRHVSSGFCNQTDLEVAQLQQPEIERIVSLDEQDDSSGNERNVSPEESTEMQINRQRLGVNSNEERADEDEEDLDDEVDFDKT